MVSGVLRKSSIGMAFLCCAFENLDPCSSIARECLSVQNVGSSQMGVETVEQRSGERSAHRSFALETAQRKVASYHRRLVLVR